MTDPGICPDLPLSFGPRSSWLAIQSESTAQIASELPLRNAQPANWAIGLEAAETKIFVAPAIAAWSFVIGTTLPYAGASDCLALLVRLSTIFQRCQYFASEPVTEYHAWSMAERGQVIRAYAYLGERGETLWNIGDMTVQERELGFHFYDASSSEARDEGYWSRGDLRYPEVADVFTIAGKWSLNPEEIADMPTTPGIGILGDLMPFTKR